MCYILWIFANNIICDVIELYQFCVVFYEFFNTESNLKDKLMLYLCSFIFK